VSKDFFFHVHPACTIPFLLILFGIVPTIAIAQSQLDSAALEARYPSSTTCRTCHPDQYREWSVSAHAYAQMSPVFNAFQGALLQLTNGTNGDFCIRCHNQVWMNAGEEEFKSNMDRFSA
jgi:hypothetical protein